MAKLFLFGPSSGLYSCPLAMVDGAAKVIETVMKDTECESKFLEEPFRYRLFNVLSSFYKFVVYCTNSLAKITH